MRIIKNIIRLIQWVPVIWNDVDWDYEGLLTIIDYKVRRMRQLHLNGSNGAHWSERVLEMDKLRHLIELQKEDPDDEWNSHYWSGWHSHGLKDPLCKKPKECKKMLDLSGRRLERNWHNIWSYLDENLRNWWD